MDAHRRQPEDEAPEAANGTLAEALAAADGVWQVLHTRSRQEKAVAREGRLRGLRCYLPLQPSLASGRAASGSLVPVIPGYVFARGDRDAVYEIDRRGRLANILPVPDEAGLERDLANIDNALRGGGRLTGVRAPAAGDWVKIVRGPFVGTHGLVERTAHPARVHLVVRSLGTAVALEVDAWDLEPLDTDELARLGARPIGAKRSRHRAAGAC